METDQRHCSLDRMTGFPAGGPAAPEGRVCGAVVSWQEWPASVHTCAYLQPQQHRENVTENKPNSMWDLFLQL